PAASLERTDATTRQIDRILLDTPGIEAFTTIGGFNLSNRVTASNNAFYFVGLKPWSERDGRGLEAPALVSRLNARFRREVPEATVFANMPPSIPGLGTQGGFSMWLQDRGGGTIQGLDQTLQKFLAAARQRPELAGVTSPFN